MKRLPPVEAGGINRANLSLVLLCWMKTAFSSDLFLSIAERMVPGELLSAENRSLRTVLCHTW